MESVEPGTTTGSGTSASGRPLTSVRGPSLSSQKYKSFYYSRVESVAEEDHLDGNNAPSSYQGSFSFNVENEDNTSLEIANSPSQDGASSTACISKNTRINENSSTVGNSEPILNKPMASSSPSIQQHITPDHSTAPTNKRLQRLILSPPSLHMSFDVDSGNWPVQTEKLTGEKPWSRSSDNVMNKMVNQDMQHLLDGTGVGVSASPVHGRHVGHAAGFRAHEIAQISAGYMRSTGLRGQFRGVLSAPLEKGSLLRLNLYKKQNSKEKERQRKEGSGLTSKKTSTTTLVTLSGHGSIQKDHVEMATYPSSVDDTGENVQNGGNGTNIPINNYSIDTAEKMSQNLNLNIVKDTADGTNTSPRSPDESDNADGTKCYRLEYHRNLFEQRRKACDYSFAFALIGIAFMILETEFTAAGIYTKESAYSFALKSLIVISTVILLIFILAYHASDIKLFMMDHGCDDCRIAIRGSRITLIIFELILCMICPFPGNYYYTYHSGYIQPQSNTNDDSTTLPSPSNSSTQVPIDIIFSIPMFLRLYLICRLMLLRSRLFTDGPSRSISALNRVKITARLVLKMMMTVSPGTVLLIFTGTFWLTAAWIMLVCERYGTQFPQNMGSGGYEYETRRHQSIINYESSKHQSYLNSLWLVAVTSLTIGYGDIVPNTYCGRTVSIVCGIVGAGTSSLVVAVVAKKLEFSRAEKHVHNFMMDSSLSKRMKNAAANVLRETWLIYKYRKLAKKVDAAKVRYHQRKFLIAIYELRKTKRGRRKLDENFITVGDMAKMTLMTYEIVSEMRTRQQEMEQKIMDTERRYANVEAYIGQLQISLCALPELVAKKVRAPSPKR